MNELTIIIKKYIKGRASEKEVAAVEKRMAEDADFAEEVAFQRDVLKSLQYVEQQDLKSFFGGLKPQLLANLKADDSKTLGEKLQYSLEQLKQWFAPLPLYERRIAVALRSESAAILLQPQSGMNCADRQLTFRWVLPKGGMEELDLILENNRREVLLEESLEIAAETYTILLSQEQFPPGRYYWKFCMDDEDPIMGVFFVEKHLI